MIQEFHEYISGSDGHAITNLHWDDSMGYYSNGQSLRRSISDIGDMKNNALYHVVVFWNTNTEYGMKSYISSGYLWKDGTRTMFGSMADHPEAEIDPLIKGLLDQGLTIQEAMEFVLL